MRLISEKRTATYTRLCSTMPVSFGLGLLSICTASVAQTNFYLDPSPIIVTDGTGLGTTTVRWNTNPAVSNTIVYQGSSVLDANGGPSGSVVTGKSVSDGLVFTLKNANTQAVLATAVARVVPSYPVTLTMSPIQSS